jgi:hypothetical protein
MARIVKSGVLGNIVTFNLTVMRTYRPDENPYLRTAWRRNVRSCRIPYTRSRHHHISSLSLPLPLNFFWAGINIRHAA